MSTRVWESTVVNGPVSAVWALLRPLDFSFLPSTASHALEGKLTGAEVGSVHVVSYKDKTVQKLRLTELSDARRTLSWDLVESTPAHHVMSASYSVKLREITQGKMTFVEWVVDFSKDATQAVVLDASFKAKDLFKALAATVKAHLVQQGAEAKIGSQKVSVPQLKRQLSAKSAELSKIFAALDKNGNGVLEFDEFALAVGKLYGESLNDEAVKMLLREADTNNDQLVSYDEFVRFLDAEGLTHKARAAQAKENKEIPALKLHYFGIRGRAETSRLLLTEAGLNWEDKRYDQKDWAALKPKAPFGQMPLLEIGTGSNAFLLAQSPAIGRYVARLGGLYGSSDVEAGRIDAIFECVEKDLGAAYAAAAFNKDEKAKAEQVEKFWSVTAPIYLAGLEKQLAANNQGKGYFVGNTVSLADIHFYSLFSWILESVPTALNKYPLLHQLVTRVATRPNIAAYIKKRPVTPF